MRTLNLDPEVRHSSLYILSFKRLIPLTPSIAKQEHYEKRRAMSYQREETRWAKVKP
jgi:hypothetical protein